MAIDPQEFAGYLSNIKTAVYGEEVRGSIHDSIEAMYEAVQENVTTVAKVSGDSVSDYGVAADAKDLQEYAIIVRGKLGSSGETINLNDIRETGVYRLVDSVTYLFSPLTTGTGFLVVYRYNDGGRNCIQIMYETGSVKSTYNTYTRNYSAGSQDWTSWQSSNSVIDATLTQEGQPADAKAVGDMFRELMYSPIEITDLNYNVTTEDGVIASNDPRYPENANGARVEVGSVVINMNYQWTTNKTPVKVTIDGDTVSLDRNGTLSQLHITTDKTWTFKVKEEAVGSLLPYTDSKAATVRFLPRIYWGTAVYNSDPDSAFLENFRDTGSILLDNLERTFTVTAAAGEYIWYAYPMYYGIADFMCNGFKGGFELVKVMRFTNKYGVSDSYYIYKSVQPSLGNVTIDVIQAS